jgi:hypothetical protein
LPARRRPRKILINKTRTNKTRTDRTRISK